MRVIKTLLLVDGYQHPSQRKKMKKLHNKQIVVRSVPRKKGQHRGSKSHSDLYTDENPKGTIKGLKFATSKRC